jgi:RecA/RadA recombinase
MGRKRLEDSELDGAMIPSPEDDEVIASTPLKLDVSKLVEKARGRFSKDKNKASLAKFMQQGSGIALSNNPSDYITSTKIQEFWKPLTGILGAPFGRIIQIAGRPDSGKSTIGMLFMKAAQDAGYLVILWDAEGKFDSVRFKERMGGDPAQLVVAPSRNILDGVAQVVAYVRAAKEMNPDQKILIVWDSVGASINSAEDEENDDYSKQPGVTAKEVSFGIRRFNQIIEKTRNLETGEYTIACICINQVYAKIGFMAKGYQQKGGSELEYLSSLILEMTSKGALTKQRQGKKIKFGITTRAKVSKNHLFGGEDCVAELELVVSSGGISLAKEIKMVEPDIEGWSEEEE